MRKFVLFFIALIACCNVIAQTNGTVRKIVALLPEQSFYLNGGFRASLGGKSRVFYKIDLPSNAVEWYYSFSTTLNPQSGSYLKLASQLTKFIDVSGTTAIATELLFSPTGVAFADVYLFDRQNVDAFMQKADLSGTRLRSFISGSRENYKQGVVPIKDIRKGTWYLGFKNPSTTEGINLSLEVVAIVEEKIQQTEEQEKAQLYGSMGWNAYLGKDYAKSIEYSKRALQLEPNMPWVKCNIALCKLVQDNSECIDDYVEAIASCKKAVNTKQLLQAALKDINDATTLNNGLRNSTAILSLLRQELNRLNSNGQ